MKIEANKTYLPAENYVIEIKDVPVVAPPKDLTESGKYTLLTSTDKFVKGFTECDSKGTFNSSF